MTFSNNYYIKLILLLFVGQACFSQNNYHAEWFSADSNHLPQNSVKSIVPDKYGYLWLSTENGIVRYDGQNFKIFNAGNIKGLDSNRMLLFTGSIKKDSVLVLNDRGKILLINQRTVKKIDEIKRPEKMLKAFNQGAYFIHPSIPFAKKKSNFAFTVKDETYFFSSDSMYIYNTEFKLKKQLKYTFEDSSRFFITNENVYLLGDNNDYSACKTSSLTKKFDRSFSKSKWVHTNAAAQQSFIYSENQLFYIKDSNGRLSTKLIYDNFDCKTNNIVSVYYDERNDILFLGSTNKGLLIVKKQDFRHNATSYHHSTGTDNVYYALTKHTNTSILASTGEIFDQNGTTALIDIGSYTDKYMLIADNNGDVWTKKAAFLYRFSKKSGFKKFDKWEFKTAVSTLTKALNGQIFIGLYDEPGKKKGWLYTINPDDAFPSPQFFLKLESTPSDITDIDGKTLWAGSWKGLYKIYLNTKKVRKIESINNTQIRNIYAPNPNEAWICTYTKGFYIYRNNKITQLPTDRNGYLLNSHCVVEDRQGFVWITTNKGLFTAKKQDIYDYADNKIKHIYYHLHNKSSGFLNNEFNGGCKPCAVNLNDETIFFPSMDGIVYFNPDMVTKSQPRNRIFLDQTDNDNITYPADSLIFSRNFGKIKFFLSSPFFGTAYNQNIETRLEGPVTQNWTHMTENNVSFSTLPPGDYILKTRKLEGFGSKYIHKDFRFSITPAFWQTEWFKIIMILLGIVLIYFIYKLRVRYIKHKNIQLEKQVVLKTQQLQTTIVALRKTKIDLSRQVSNHKSLIRTITHDIKSPLKFIAITGRFLYKNIDKPETISKDDIKAIHTSSSQLYHFVDNFLEYTKETDLNNSESEPYYLHYLVNEKTAFFNNIADAGKTVMKNEVDIHLAITLNRHLLAIILHNLLDNALKNTINGIISIKAFTGNNTLYIYVSDTGKGIDQETISYYMSIADGKSSPSKQNGMGLHMIIELLTILGGTMHISSQAGSGTTITLLFPQKIN